MKVISVCSRAKELINAIVQQRSRTEGTGGARLDDLNMGGTPPNMSHVSNLTIAEYLSVMCPMMYKFILARIFLIREADEYIWPFD